MQLQKSLKHLALTAYLAIGGTAFASNYPEIDFSNRPHYLHPKIVALSFDDAPDWNNTTRVLDALRQKNAKGTFFLNSENWSNLNVDEPMRELVRRMANEGHTLGNHAAHHVDFSTLAPHDIEREISAVENSVQSIFWGNGPRLSLFRAPLGEPYRSRGPQFDQVASIVSRHAVHVGWSIDSKDYECGDSSCVYNNVVQSLQSGSYGVILLHSVYAHTAEALPAIIDYLWANGYQIWSVEDIVRTKYGQNSAALVGAGNWGHGHQDDGNGNNGSWNDDHNDGHHNEGGHHHGDGHWNHDHGSNHHDNDDGKDECKKKHDGKHKEHCKGDGKGGKDGDHGKGDGHHGKGDGKGGKDGDHGKGDGHHGKGDKDKCKDEENKDKEECKDNGYHWGKKH